FQPQYAFHNIPTRMAKNAISIGITIDQLRPLFAPDRLLNRIPQMTAKPASFPCGFCGHWFNITRAKRKWFAARANTLTGLRESISTGHNRAQPGVSTDRRGDDSRL